MSVEPDSHILSPEVAEELRAIALRETPFGATIGLRVHTLTLQEFGAASARLADEQGEAAEARHAAALRRAIVRPAIEDEVTTALLMQDLHQIHQILAPGVALEGPVESIARMATELMASHMSPFETSVQLLVRLSRLPSPAAGALARVACNIPIRHHRNPPLTFFGVDEFFPGLGEYEASGDSRRLVRAYRIAYDASARRWRGYFI